MSTDILVPLLSGLATGLGGLSAVFWGSSGLRSLSLLLGAAAGIGFTIVFFDLLPTAVELGSYGITAAGFFSGFLLGWLVDIALPHLHLAGSCPTCSHNRPQLVDGRVSGRKSLQKTAYLLAFGMALHNLPEGLAIGAGFEASVKLGLILAFAISIHNIPEGMALVGLLKASGQNSITALSFAIGVGLFIPAGALIGMRVLLLTPDSLSFMLALGAGTLLYVVWSELIPESCKMHRVFSRLGIAGGFLLSMALSLFGK